MKLTVNLKENSYPIYIENGILNRAGEYIADLFHGQRIMIKILSTGGAYHVEFANFTYTIE